MRTRTNFKVVLEMLKSWIKLKQLFVIECNTLVSFLFNPLQTSSRTWKPVQSRFRCFSPSPRDRTRTASPGCRKSMSSSSTGRSGSRDCRTYASARDLHSRTRTSSGSTLGTWCSCWGFRKRTRTTSLRAWKLVGREDRRARGRRRTRRWSCWG